MSKPGIAYRQSLRQVEAEHEVDRLRAQNAALLKALTEIVAICESWAEPQEGMTARGAIGTIDNLARAAITEAEKGETKGEWK